jgi:hypothetical protein
MSEGIDAQAIVNEILNKQLEKYNLTIDSPEIKGDPEWYRNYTTTQEENQSWMEWGVAFIRKKLRMSNLMAEKEMAWINLQWGLKVEQ